jgi:hypothetical protein
LKRDAFLEASLRFLNWIGSRRGIRWPNLTA